MSARSRMRMRATVERDTRVDDDYGGDGLPQWQPHLAGLPCYAWHKRGGGNPERYGVEAVMSDYYPAMIVPLGTDIKETDRVAKIEDLRGAEVFGAMVVTGVLRRRDHIEVRMSEHA